MRLLAEQIEQDQDLRLKINQQISVIVAQKFESIGQPVPVPYLKDGQFIYHDQRVQKYVNHLREGIHLLADLLDQRKEKPQ